MLKQDKIEKALKSVKGSLAAEGLHLLKEEEELIIKRVKGEISEAEFRKQVLEGNYNDRQ